MPKTFAEVMKAGPKLPKKLRPKLSAGQASGKFDPAKHPRNPDGTFADKPGAGNDAPRQGAAFDPSRAATFAKDRPLPKSLHGVPFAPWDDVPTTPEGWAKVKGQRKLKEPPLPKLKPGMKLGSGVIIREPDGRIWLTKPTNGFGGYDHTFPKGTAEEGLSLQANAIKEAFEETGLKVEITGFAGDVERTTSVARYYYARRVGGSPAAHGWESEAVLLVPPAQLHHYLNVPLDQRMAHELAGAPVPPPKPEAPPASFGQGLVAPQFGIGQPSQAKGGGKPKPQVWGGKAGGGKATLFDNLYSSLGWSKPVRKEAGPVLFDQAVELIEKAVKLPPHISKLVKPGKKKPTPGQVRIKGDGDGDGIPYEDKIKKPSAPRTKKVELPKAGSVAAAAKLHGVDTAKWPVATNGAAASAKKWIEGYEAAWAAGDLDTLASLKPNLDALLPGKGNPYTKGKAKAWQALHEDLVAQKASKAMAEATAGPVATKGWTKVGGQLGSNPGGQFTDAAGVKHYVKFSKSADHAKNEAVAAKLYELVGSPVVPVKLADVEALSGGAAKLGIASTWVSKTPLNPNSQAHLALAAEDFATHAWLANWDAVGTGFDNLALVDGKMSVLDVGGSLLFRAQGGPKGAAFGVDAVEWDTMRSLKTPGDAPKVFSSMTAEQLHASAKKVANIPDDAIRDVVMAHGPGSLDDRKALAEVLIKRKQSIVAKADALGLGPVKTVGAVPEPNAAAVAKVADPPAAPPAGRDITPATAQAAKAPRAPKAAAGALDDAEITAALGAEAKLFAGTPHYDAMFAAVKAGDEAALAAVKTPTALAKADKDALLGVLKAKKGGPAPAPAPESVPTVTPVALPAVPTKITSPANPLTAQKKAVLDTVQKAAADYAAGTITAEAALAAMGAVKFPNVLNTYWKPLKKWQVESMAAISTHATAKKAAQEAAEKAAQAAKAAPAPAAPAAAPAASLTPTTAALPPKPAVAPAQGKKVTKVAAKAGFNEAKLAAGYSSYSAIPSETYMAGVKVWQAAKAGDLQAFMAADASIPFVAAVKNKLAHKIGAPKPLLDDELAKVASGVTAKHGAVNTSGADYTADGLALFGAAKQGDLTALMAHAPQSYAGHTLKAHLFAEMVPPGAKLKASQINAVAIQAKAAKGAKLTKEEADEVAALAAAAKAGPAALGATSPMTYHASQVKGALMAEFAAPYGAVKAGQAAAPVAAAPAAQTASATAAAVPTPAVPLIQQPAKAKPPKFDPAKLTEPPSFLNWSGPGQGLSKSHPKMNEVNEGAVKALFEAGKSGDPAKVKALMLDTYDLNTKQVGAKVGFENHPSKHVKGYGHQLLAEIDAQLNPPKHVSLRNAADIKAIHEAFVPQPATAPDVEKVGRYLALGSAQGSATIGDDLPKLSKKNGKSSGLKYKMAAQEAFSKMSVTQQDAIRNYTDGDYDTINGSLWGGNPNAAAQAVKSAIATHGHYVEAGTLLSRRFTPKLPKDQGGGVDKVALNKLLASEGKVLQDLGIISTSVDAGVWHGDIQLKITVGPGVKGLFVGPGSHPNGGAISYHPSEDEIILPPDTRFLVKRVRKAGIDEDGFGGGGEKHVIEVLALPNE